MARSTKIYVVLDLSAGDVEDAIIATFTVKWELQEWLERHKNEPHTDSWAIFSSADGLSQKPKNRVFLKRD